MPLPAAFHSANRRRLAGSIPADAIAIIDTAAVQYRSADVEYPFRPDSNFYYLTGVSEPEAVLILIPGASNPEAREYLFVSGTSEFVGTWEGERLTADQATELSGIKRVMATADLPRVLDRLLTRYHTIYMNAAESLEAPLASPSARRASRLRRAAPLHELRSVLPMLGRQRMLKDPAEVQQIRAAVAATAAGLGAAWSKLAPGAHEYTLAAELSAEYERRGGTHAFTPVVAAGRNANFFHYTRSDAVVSKDDLVLTDTGAEIGWYAADITRTVPAASRFSERQRAVYGAVLRAQKEGIERCKPGATVLSVDQHICDVLTEELGKLGLKGPLRDYYAHLSHHLGLDCHDTGEPDAKFAPGMVVTCEPGLYLRKEGIGVRIEDDLLITEDGCEVLSREIPSDPDEIENLLLSK